MHNFYFILKELKIKTRTLDWLEQWSLIKRIQKAITFFTIQSKNDFFSYLILNVAKSFFIYIYFVKKRLEIFIFYKTVNNEWFCRIYFKS